MSQISVRYDGHEEAETRHAASLWDPILDRSAPPRPTTLTRILDADTVPGRTLHGHTAFFRHNNTYDEYLEVARGLHAQTGEKVTLMSVGSSVGAEVYSIAFRASLQALGHVTQMRALDLSKRFSDVARAGIYPQTMVGDIDPQYIARYMSPYGDGYMRVHDHFRKKIEVLPPRDAETLAYGERKLADISIMANILGYMDPDGQGAMIRAVAKRTTHAIALYVGFNESVTPHLNAADLVPDDGEDRFTELHVWNKMTARRPLIAYKKPFRAHPRRTTHPAARA